MGFPRLAGRLLVALPGIALFLIILFRLETEYGLFLFSALSLVSAWEAVELCCRTGLRPAGRILVSFFAGVSTLLIAVDHPLAIPSLFLSGATVTLCVIATMGPKHSRRRMAGTSALVAFYAMGFGILGRLFVAGGGWPVLAVLALCWVGDSAAYFTGLTFGRHKMAPAVSPAKSWEGFYGGLAGAVVGCVLVGHFGGISLVPMVVLGVAGGAAGALGDLFESSLKRDAGIKDSGTLLLGHGGFLDRFDSAVAAAPVALAVFTLFGVM